MKRQTMSSMVETDVRDLLHQHADDCGRSASREGELWLTFGAGLIEFASTLVPGAPEMMIAEGLVPDEVREAQMARLTRTLAQALPHGIDPAAVMRAAMPPMSQN